MSRLIVAGVDLSLTSTGIALAEFDGPLMSPSAYRLTSVGKAGAGLPERQTRLHKLTAAVTDKVAGADLILVEGPAFGSTTGSMHDRSGLWWLVVDTLVQEYGSIVVEVAPSARAKYATGAGNAGKDAVLAAAVKRYPDWDITGNDIADAVIIAAMGCRHLGQPIDSLPQVHLAAMTKVRWPATESGAPA